MSLLNDRDRVFIAHDDLHDFAILLGNPNTPDEGSTHKEIAKHLKWSVERTQRGLDTMIADGSYGVIKREGRSCYGR